MTHQLVWVGLGGALGAIARVLVGVAVTERLGILLPYGTLVVNLSGCLLLGLLIGAMEAQVVHPGVRPALTVGFLGAYTTFSTFSFETIALFEEGQALLALVYVLASVVFGLATVALGLWIGRALG